MIKLPNVLTFALACGVGAVSPSAHAAALDVVQTPTDFFVPTDAQKFDAPYYRAFNQDWEWVHNPIPYVFTPSTVVTLNIGAFDVDFAGDPSHTGGERDMISAFNGTDWVDLGFLDGSDETWSFTTFTLDPGVFAAVIASGLQVRINIDSTLTDWNVALSKSVLSLDNADLPSPLPGVPVPAALPMFVSGLGLFAALAKRRKGKAL